MTKQDLLSKLAHLDNEHQIEWMLHLGADLTIAARSAGYEVGTNNADGKALRGFNEIQHRVYARIRDLKLGHEWTIESFVSMILEHSVTFGIEGDVGWALKHSLPKAAH